MAANKVVYNGKTLIDLTGDTAAAGNMLSGTKAHDKSGASVTGSIQSQAAKTITPSRSKQTAIAKGKYASGAVTVAPIPSTYYTMAEAIAALYPVGSLWATEDSTKKPATVLGIGTWQQISPVNATWGDLYDEQWGSLQTGNPSVYVYKRLT